MKKNYKQKDGVARKPSENGGQEHGKTLFRGKSKCQEKAGKTQEIVFDDVDNDLRYREVRRG